MRRGLSRSRTWIPRLATRRLGLLTLASMLAACADEPSRPGSAARTPGDDAPAAGVSAHCGEVAPSRDPALVTVYFNCAFAEPGALAPAARAAPAAGTAPAAGAAPAPGAASELSGRLRVALEALLAGPSAEERRRGYSSSFSERTADALLDVRVNARGDTVWLDFRNFVLELPDDPAVKSFLPPGVMAGLTWTIFSSFPGIEAVHFAFDGSEAAFWAWLGGDAQAFTRRHWEQI